VRPRDDGRKAAQRGERQRPVDDAAFGQVGPSREREWGRRSVRDHRTVDDVRRHHAHARDRPTKDDRYYPQGVARVLASGCENGACERTVIRAPIH
jgi:hypothetical protein